MTVEWVVDIILLSKDKYYKWRVTIWDLTIAVLLRVLVVDALNLVVIFTTARAVVSVRETYILRGGILEILLRTIVVAGVADAVGAIEVLTNQDRTILDMIVMAMK